MPWNEDTFTRLTTAEPESLASSFAVSHSMVLNVLARAVGGVAAGRRLLVDNHEPRAAQRRHIRRAVAITRSLLAAGVIERVDTDGVVDLRVDLDLQSDFSLNQPLSPFVLHALRHLDRESPSYPLDVLSLVESTLENPTVVLNAQLSKLKGETITALKAQGMEYEERMAILDTLEHPKPLRELTYALFDEYRLVQPWVEDHNIRPKSVARDLYERAMTFADYIDHYQLARSEGLVLRYLGDAYKGLVQTVPEDAKTDDLFDLAEWLGETVRQVDSSLLDEWELLRAGIDPALTATPTPSAATLPGPPPGVTTNTRAFRVMVRNELFRLVEQLARRDYAPLTDHGFRGDDARWDDALAPYWALHASIGRGADARSPALFQVREHSGLWRVRQVLDDPEGDHDWAIEAQVDLAASDDAGAPVVEVLSMSDDPPN